MGGVFPASVNDRFPWSFSGVFTLAFAGIELSAASGPSFTVNKLECSKQGYFLCLEYISME